MPRDKITVFLWQAPEFRHYPKNPAWYITFAVIAILLVGYQVLQKDFFGAISLAVIGVIVTIFAHHKPQEITIEISDLGIHINGDLIPYNRIRKFWIINDGTHKTLNFETTAYINHILTLELEDLDSDELHEFLSEILPEHEDPNPTTSQRLSHWFRF